MRWSPSHPARATLSQGVLFLETIIMNELGILRTSYPPAANGRLGDAENPDFQPLIIGKPRHSLGFLPSRAHLSRSRQ